MKWILLLLTIGILRGLLLPDYRWEINMLLIPFITPLFLAFLAIYLSSSCRLAFKISVISGLFSVYISDCVGVVVYGFWAGWHNVTDSETIAVFVATALIQTLVYSLSVLVSYFLVKIYNKAQQK